MLLKTYLFVIITACISASGFSQVVINEYSASNLRTFKDNFNDSEDWIELYNNGETDINIGGYYLSDKESKPTKWAFPSNTIITGKGYLLVWASGRNLSGDGHFHTNFKFTQTKGDEYVVLADKTGKILDKTSFQITQLDHSVCKSVDGNTTWRITTVPTPGGSNDTVPQYLGYAPQPLIDSLPGYYADKIKVSISSDTAKYIARFTTTGNHPVASSPKFSNPINIDRIMVLKATNFPKDSNYLPSQVAFSTYFVKAPASTLPILSVSGKDVTTLANGNREFMPVGSMEVFDKTMTSRTAVSYGEVDSHGQDSWVNDQRSLDWISRDEMGFNNSINQKLFNYSDRDSYQRIILRASGDDNYPATNQPEHKGSAHVRDEFVHTIVQQSGMHMDVRALERYLVFLNGRYWGVYTIREKPDDHDYMSETYDQDKYDIQFLKTWGESWTEYGGDRAQPDWSEFRDSVLNNDLSTPAMYEYINDNMDVTSLFDYMLANLSFVSSDWLNYNTGWWRGLNPAGKHKKWGYIMWDNDATFDYYINYSGVPNTSPDAKACDIDEISLFMDDFFPVDTTLQVFGGDSVFIDGEWIVFPIDSFYQYPDLGKHEKIFLKMINENDQFRNQYFARYVDMNNVAFSCENMLGTLDSLIAIIEPEMPRHITRWPGGSLTEWQSNVTKLRSFVEERCTLLNQGLIDCYSLSGPYNITILTDPPGAGEIKLNTINHKTLPWSGEYLGNMVNTVKVKPNTNSAFIKWKSKNGATTFKNILDLESNITLTASDTLTAVFVGATATIDIKDIALKSFPNPANSSFTLIVPESIVATVSVVDILGNQVYSNDKSIINGQIKFDVETWHSGSYFIKIISDSKVYVSQVKIVRL